MDLAFVARISLAVMVVVLLTCAKIEVRAGDGVRVTHQVARALRPPRIDGVLNDQCWESALRFDAFRPLKGRGGQSSLSTLAVLTYDDDAVYVGFRCNEPEMGALKALVAEHDGPVWQEDCVELFLDTSGQGSGYAHVAVNASGVIRDAWCKADRKEDLGWDSGASAAVLRDGAGWTIEIRLPLDALPLVGEQPSWTFQLARTRSAAPRHFTMLSSSAVSYHVPGHFEPLRGVELHERPIRVTDATLGEHLPGLNRARVVLRNDHEAEATVTIRVAIDGGDAVERSVGIPPGAVVVHELPWMIAAETRARARLGVYWRGRYMGGLNEPLASLPVLGELGRRTFVIEPGRPLIVRVPVALATDSRESAELRWELCDATGAVQDRGTAAVDGPQASLLLERIDPGRYELRLSLRWGDGGSANRRESLYFVESPFIHQQIE